MPLIEDQNTQIAAGRLVRQVAPEEDVGFGEAFAAAFRQDTMLGAYIFAEQGLPDQVAQTENFNPVDHFTEYEKLDNAFIQGAAMADSVGELDAFRRQYQRENRDRATLENAGAMGVIAGIGAQFLDPINFIPVGGVTYKTYRLGHNILKGAAVTGSVAMGTTAVQEAALHELQLTRTFGESAINVAGAALLGGVLGGGAAGLSTAARKANRALDSIEPDVQQSMNPEEKILRNEPSSGTTEMAIERIDTIFASDLKIADQIEAESIAGYKHSLEQKLDVILPLGVRKQLNAEKKQLEFELKNVEKTAEPLPTEPGMGARRAKQAGIRQASTRLTDRIADIDRQLAESKVGEDARADLSRLEQGIVPKEIRESINMRKAQATRIEEVLTSEEYVTIRDELEAEFDKTGKVELDEEEDLLTRDALGEDSAGAMKVLNAPTVKGKLARGILKTISLFDPVSRLSTSRSPVSRALLAEMAETNFVYDKMKVTAPVRDAAGDIVRDAEGNIVEEVVSEFDFKPNAIETRIKTRADGLHIKALQFAHKQLKAYRASNPDNPMTNDQFFEQIAFALRRGDVHQNEFIQDAAQNWRREVYDPLLKDANKILGPDNRPLLGEDIDTATALSYLNRKFRPDKIRGNSQEWRNVVGKWLQAEDIRVRKAEGKDLDDLPTIREYEELAQEIANRIASEPGGALPYDYQIGENSAKGRSAPVRGPLQKRKFLIPDELIEQFLENDVRKLSRNYTNNMVAQLEFMDTFGSMDMDSQLKDVNKWWDDYIKTQPKKDHEKLESLKDKERIAIEGMRDRISYQFRSTENPDALTSRMARGALNLNYIRLGGGFVPASFSDTARIIAAEGLGGLVKVPLLALTKGMKGIKLVAQEAQEAGIAIDMLTGSNRAAAYADINDAVQGKTVVERALQTMADRFGRVNLMDQWTTAMKTWHIASMQNRLIKQLKAGKYDKRLIHLGIDESDAAGIGAQLKKYSGDPVQGFHLAKAKDWDDPKLMDLWQQALRKESDRVIIIPGQEKPLFMSKQHWQVVLQFKSFMYAATHKIVIGTVQGREAHAVQGAIAMLGMGMMTYAIKEKLAGNELSEDPRVWVDEGLDRSGMLGLFGEIENTIEKISGGAIGIRPFMGVDEQSSRYAARSAYEAAAGPTYGSLLNTILRVGNAGLGDEVWQDSDTRALRRLLPYQNLFYLRSGIDLMEEQAHETLFE